MLSSCRVLACALTCSSCIGRMAYNLPTCLPFAFTHTHFTEARDGRCIITGSLQSTYIVAPDNQTFNMYVSGRPCYSRLPRPLCSTGFWTYFLDESGSKMNPDVDGLLFPRVVYDSEMGSQWVCLPRWPCEKHAMPGHASGTKPVSTTNQ
ncbi:hypothetical protein F5Y15DRAFT_70339 [Xylariaceae sp. FL0016]|nr:hypothetical protein F5Y15DRAFT_70339 [Xylariaceae sp. FL0016]